MSIVLGKIHKIEVMDGSGSLPGTFPGEVSTECSPLSSPSEAEPFPSSCRSRREEGREQVDL